MHRGNDEAAQQKEEIQAALSEVLPPACQDLRSQRGKHPNRQRRKLRYREKAYRHGGQAFWSLGDTPALLVLN